MKELEIQICQLELSNFSKIWAVSGSVELGANVFFII